MKKRFKTSLYSVPTCQLILGTHTEEKPNFMALAWATRINFKPPLMAIGVNRNHQSHENIVKNREFSLCMPSTKMVAITDYVGLVSGRNSDKSDLFPLFYGQLDKAPMIESCPITLELSLYKQVEMETNTLFIGEIVAGWCDEKHLSDAKPDMAAVDPFVLTMPDNTYWKLGQPVGKGWSAGKELKKSGS